MKKKIKILILSCAFAVTAVASKAQTVIVISANVAPPALPVYDQPACPVDGYLWVPGYWAYNDTNGYYWVPGVWTAPPNPGLLWTPAYWGYDGGVYGFHAGYWGATIGFYGGINYGYGYGGVGFVGGRWDGGSFRYNTAVMHVNNVVIHNTYEDRTVIRDREINRASFNGHGGIDVRPRPEEEAAMRERHFDATSEQRSHQEVASRDRSQLARVNGGHPAAAAMDRVNGTPVRENRPAASANTGQLNRGNNATPANNRSNVNRNPAGQANANRNASNPNRQANANRPAVQANANRNQAGTATANKSPGGPGAAQRSPNGQANANKAAASAQRRTVPAPKAAPLRTPAPPKKH